MGRTGQLVLGENKGRQVDELAEFRGDRPCQRKEHVFKASGRLDYQLGRFSTNCNKVIVAH